ncbi:DsrE/DsrF-like family protein [bacterium BMS3Bbin14]|nr:DsrE/DsrF-like family protein [bacterium BMS3Bbin14]
MKTLIHAIMSILLITLLFGATTAVCAEPINDAAALSGLKSAKAIFLVNSTDPRKVAYVLRLVGKTAASMRRQGVKIHVVVVVVGRTVAFLTKDRRGISYQDQRPVAEIQKTVRNLRKAGIRTEACGVALHGSDIDPTAVIPSVHVVGNGFISAIAYQQKGYSLIPVY